MADNTKRVRLISFGKMMQDADLLNTYSKLIDLKKLKKEALYMLSYRLIETLQT